MMASPVPSHPHTFLSDGDLIFSLATGTFEGEVNLTQVGALAAEAVADASIRAARRRLDLSNSGHG